MQPVKVTYVGCQPAMPNGSRAALDANATRSRYFAREQPGSHVYRCWVRAELVANYSVSVRLRGPGC